jgi:hypothetical protein
MESTNDELPTRIIKSDRRGRPRYTQQYKDEVITAFEASGMSGAAFAEHCGLKYSTFAAWAAKKRRASDGSAEPERSRQFVLAEFGTAPEAGELHIELPSGASTRFNAVCQINLLAALLRALA